MTGTEEHENHSQPDRFHPHIISIGVVLAAYSLRLCLPQPMSNPPNLYSDHMVIQQGVKVPVWGWADPNEPITITLGSAEQSAKADAEGKWMFHLPAENQAMRWR